MNLRENQFSLNHVTSKSNLLSVSVKLMNTKLILNILLAALVFGNTVKAAGLLNGDFESPYLGTTGYNFSTPPDGFAWSLAWGDFDINSTNLTLAASGLQSVDLNGFSPGGIYQDFNFESSGSWMIQFSMAPNPDTSAIKSLSLLLTPNGGSTLNLGTFSRDPAGLTWANVQWETYSTIAFDVDSSTTYRLQFDSLGSGASGPMIDNVLLVSTVPEPSSCTLVVCGLLLLGMQHRRRLVA
jgi:hypothetical protein